MSSLSIFRFLTQINVAFILWIPVCIFIYYKLFELGDIFIFVSGPNRAFPSTVTLYTINNPQMFVELNLYEFFENDNMQ